MSDLAPPPFARERFLALEAHNLAAYACHAAQTRGRRHDEPPHALRTDYQRDRDRVIHSRAFRRLEYKTQVFVTGADDHFRTRLTHTMEVAGIARTIARCLGLNEDLAETISLAHDLGHPPFGHCGERALDRLLARHNGFDHNDQALKVVDELEIKYPGFAGLNLTCEVRAGLIKHRVPGAMLDGCPLPPQMPLEAQVADVADDLTYLSHDLDDGISAGLLTEDDLADLALWRLAGERQDGGRVGRQSPCYYTYRVRNLIDMLVADAVATSRKRLADAAVTDAGQAQNHPTPLIRFSADCEAHGDELRRFLFAHVYEHPAVDDDNQRAVRWMCKLYHHFINHPDKAGSMTRRRAPQVGIEVAVADYIASMTDRYAIEQYHRYIAG